MPEYYILTKVNCVECHGVGIITTKSRITEYNERDCETCKGEGTTFEPIYITEELINQVRESFMRERNA